MTITKSAARTELARRAHPKGSAKRVAGLAAAKKAGTLELGNAELRAIAGSPAPVKAARAAKAARPERTPEQKAATALRKRAWDERKALGMTYAQACEHFGVRPAKAEV